MNDKYKNKQQLISEIVQLRKKVAELEATDLKYRALFENLPVGIFQSTPAGQYRLVNPAFAQMTGFASPEEMINEVSDISTLYADPADREEVNRLFAEQGQVNGHVIRHRRKDGQMRLMSIYAKSVYDDFGELIYYDGFTLDITDRSRAEEAHAKSTAIINASLDPVVTTNTKGEILTWNTGAEKLYGYQQAEMLGKPISIIYKKADLLILEGLITELLKGNDIPSAEVTCIDKNGQEIDILLSLSTLKDENGNITELIGFTKDIRALKLAERQLRENQQILKEAENIAELGSWDWDMISGDVYWSDNMYQMLGYVPGKVEPSYELAKSHVHHDDLELYETKIGQAIEKQSSFSFENRMVRTDKIVCTVLSEGKVIYDDANNPIRMVGTVLNITKHKRAEEQIRYQAKLLESVSDAVVSTDNEFRIMSWNQAAERLYGWNVNEVIGKKFGAVVPVKYLNLDRDEVFAEFRQKGFWQGEIIQQDKAGNEYSVLSSVTAIPDQNGNPIGAVAVNRDITKRKRTEEALREFEMRFATIFHASPIAIALTRLRDNQLLDVNEAWLDLTGYHKEEVIGVKAQALRLWEDSEDRAHMIKALGEQGAVEKFEFQMRKKSGETTDILFSAELVDLESESYMLSMALDISERKRVEVALLENQKRYENAQAMGHVGNWEYDPVTEKFWGSDEAKRIYGFNLNTKEFTTDNVENCIPERERVHQALIDLIEHDKKYDLEFDIITRDKGLRKTIHSIAQVDRDTQGNPLKITGVISDITERKQAERTQKLLARQLEQQAHQLQMVMDSVPEGVLVIDSQGHILLANPIAQDDLLALAGGIDVGDIVQQLGQHPLKELLTRPREGPWHQIEWQNRSFELIAKPLKGKGSAEGWVIVIRDVTAEKEIQERIQQQERLASVGQLAAGIAHDFNNIMAVISLYADLSINDPHLPQDVVKRFETVKKQSNRATELIRQILDFGRRSVMERLPMDLIPHLKELKKLFQRTLPENIDIRLNYTDNNFIIDGDPTRFQQVIMNLVVNARDAMPDGGVIQINLEHIKINQIKSSIMPDLKYQLKQDQRSKDWVCLTIQDAGTGISTDILPHIFEPFYTTKEPGKGSGLGLAQVFGIIKQHDGEIDVVTAVGEGSTFLIYLPLIETTDSTNKMIEPENLPLGQGEVILVVEDNLSMQQALIDSLEMLNYRSQVAVNGREALDILRQHGNEVALILTDLVMPKMGGKGLIKAMREAGITTKVVVVSGHVLVDEKESIMALGVVDFVNKPPDLDKLAQVVAGALA